jgi:hypothetical protein
MMYGPAFGVAGSMSATPISGYDVPVGRDAENRALGSDGECRTRLVGLAEQGDGGPSVGWFDTGQDDPRPAVPIDELETVGGDGVLDPPSALTVSHVDPLAIDWALEKLGWKNPAPPAQQRRCVDMIARHAGARPIYTN